MATIVDTLVTKYTLDNKDYVKGAEGVAFATRGVVAAASTAATGIAALAAATTLAAVAPVRMAMEWDTMQRSLEAITGSAKRTADILGFIEKLAIPSIFSTSELGMAAKTLEAFQLRTEKFLPIAEKLGTIFGGTATDLMQFVNALGMIKGGRTGEGMEALARAGISRDALKVRGLQFEKSGEFKGQVSDLLKAVDQEVNQRFGTLAQKMASGPAAQMASLMDQAARGMRVFGQTILREVLPYVTALANKIGILTGSGKIQSWANNLVSMFNMIGAAVKPLAMVFAAWAGTRIAAGIMTLVEIINKLRKSLGLAAVMMATLDALAGPKAWVNIGVAAVSAIAMNEFLNKLGEEFNADTAAGGKESYGQANRDRIDNPYSNDFGQNPIAIQSEQARTLKAIEANTAPIREMMSFIFGGGELGRAGVGVTSMRGSRSHTSVHRQIAAMTSMGLLRRA